MQAQTTRNAIQSISATQSISSVQTLLRAGLSCIAFLRNLLPEDNFSESYFTTADDSYGALSVSSDATDDGRKINGFRIMTMTRGYTDEADRILNYLEYGIFDALQKQYLRSFIFAIYLDNKEPNNIIEAYTFNFKYHTLPGTDTVIPIMSFEEGARRSSTEPFVDPVAEAVKRGKTPTLKDVKRSVKTLLKTLIHAMTHMDVLPRRRFATFKVCYTDETPANYEPPHFQAGDSEKDKWFFMTHDLDEIPEKCSIGKIQTGHHSVNLSVTSIATYLPSSTEHDHGIFAGTTVRGSTVPTLTPLEEASFCAHQAEKQREDADNRNVVWSADADLELHDEDAEGEDDPEYIRGPDGRYKAIGLERESQQIAPIGIRNKEGDIEKLPFAPDGEAQFVGFCENVPTRLKEINAKIALETTGFEETQPLIFQEPSLSHVGETPICEDDSGPDAIPPPDINIETTSAPPRPVDLGSYFEHLCIDGSRAPSDVQMLDMEIQQPGSSMVESIQSFEYIKATDGMTAELVTQGGENNQDAIVDEVLDCDCGVMIEDESCFCEGGCARWFHVWCMGYNSAQDPRMPSKFICFDCRLRKDLSWELIKVDLYPKLMGRFKDLALFRRALKVADSRKPQYFADFVKSFGGENSLARQLIKRLESEGFLFQQMTTVDNLGLTTEIHTRSVKNKGKGKQKQPKQRKPNIQKPRYAFNHSMKAKSTYLDYFNPDQEVENRILGVAKLTGLMSIDNQPLHKGFVGPASQAFSGLERANETQTQETTEIPEFPFEQVRHKRGSDLLTEPDILTRPTKKLKISVAVGIDLAE